MNVPTKLILCSLIILLSLSGGWLSTAFAQNENGRQYTVQADDWLSRIAEKTYGDPFHYGAIVAATNRRAAQDSSYSVITNPDRIEVGQSLWVPDSPFVGSYRTLAPAASSPGRAITLRLAQDQSVSLITDFLNDEPVIHEIGTWRTTSNNEAAVTLDGRADGTLYDAPILITFALSVDQLDAVVYDRSQFGQAGLTLTLDDFEPTDGADGGSSAYEQLLRNGTYQGILDEPVTLRDGQFEGDPFVEGSASRPMVGLLDTPLAIGDIDGDGANDAAVVLFSNQGGSGTFIHLALMFDLDDTPRNRATALIGDRVNVETIDIDGQRITVQMITQGPNDPFCCPTLRIRATYEWAEGEFVEAGVEELGSTSDGE